MESSIAISLPTNGLATLQRVIGVSFSPTLVSSGVLDLQAHDLISGSIVLLLQGAVNIFRWYNGDITGKQAMKNMIGNFGAVAGAAGGTAAGVVSAVGMGAAAGTFAGPAGIVVGGIIGAIVGGLLFGGIARVLIEKFFPDGDLEEFLSKRNAMHEALYNLACTEAATDHDLRQAYKRGLLRYHPDKHPDRPDDQKIKE